MNIRYKINYVTSLWKRYGFRGLVMKTLERSTSPMLAYKKRYMRYLPALEELDKQRKTPLSYAPLVSIVVPAYETAEAFLRELLESVKNQTYSNWELCIADGSKSNCVLDFVKQYQIADDRIRYLRLEENGGISENTNAGFVMAKGEYIAMMDHDDILAPNALYEMVRCLGENYTEEEREKALLYSDEDKVDSAGIVHICPHFKPDYNPEFLRRNNYFCHFLMFSVPLLKRTWGLRQKYDGAQDYDFVLQCVEKGAVISHVPKILYHWRIHEGSTAGNSADKAYAFDAGCSVIEEHLKRMGEQGSVSSMANLGVYRVSYELKGIYRITVVTQEQSELKRIRDHYKKVPALDGKNGLGYYLDIHYMLAGQLSDAVLEECVGEYVLYISRQTHPEVENLLEGLLGFCGHDKTGLVSAKLCTRKKRVLSLGYTYTKKGEFVPLCGGIPKEYKGYFLHAVIPQNVSTVSFSCVMFQRKAIKESGGIGTFDEGICRDADICFRLSEKGYRIAATPEVSAVTMEDIIEILSTDEAFMEKWKERLCVPDACYNVNLSQLPGHTYDMKE